MRHGSLVLALALVVAACGDRSPINGADGGHDGSAIPDGGYQLDAPAPDAAVQEDAAAQHDAPAPNGDTGAGLIPCGTASCNSYAGEVCCAGFSGAVCMPTADCTGVPLACDGPEDCTSAAQPMCCGSFSGTGGDIACAASCTGSARRLCHVDGQCGSGEKCCGSVSFQGLSAKWCEPEATCAGSQDGGTNPTPGQVACTSAACDIPQVCCMTLAGMSVSGACEAASACTAGVPVACDGPEDCQADGGTDVCCATISFSGSLSGGAACAPAAGCASTTFGGILCHSDADCPTAGTHCTAVPYVTVPFKRCQ
ncbi:MAG TPA: hypothetical protein VGQ83_32160 [Polyangia bacterium]|jgi:hypothetical protein